MSKTNFGLNATVTVFKKQVAIESNSDNLKRFEFNKGNRVEFEKQDVIDGFKQHDIDLETDHPKAVKAMPDKVNLIKLLYDAGNGEVDIAVELEFDEDFVTNKYHEIVRLDRVGLSLRRSPKDEIKQDEPV